MIKIEFKTYFGILFFIMMNNLFATFYKHVYQVNISCQKNMYVY